MIKHNHQSDFIDEFDLVLSVFLKGIHGDKEDNVEALEEGDELNLLA